MRWLKRDIWKAGIESAGLLIFLVLMVWVPASSVGAYQGVSGLATPVTGTVQATPTVNVTATMTALQEDKLRQEIQQLNNQNEQSKNLNAADFFVWFPVWFRTNAAIILSTIVIVIGGLIGLFRWFGDRRSERIKRAEERFQAVVVGLGSKDIEAKVGSAIMLRTFLQPGYEQFYRQVFDLAVAHLRLRKVNSTQSEQPSAPNLSIIDVSGKPLQHEPDISVDSLSQALISAFKLSCPLARREADKAIKKALFLTPYFVVNYLILKRSSEQFLITELRTYWHPQALDATNIQLDNADLSLADLAEAGLSKSSFQRAELHTANLRRANLSRSNLREADMREADMNNAILIGTDLSGANIKGANLSKVSLLAANLDRTNLIGAILEGTDIEEARSLNVFNSVEGTHLILKTGPAFRFSMNQ